MTSLRSFANPFHIPNVRRFIAFRVFFNARFYYPVFTILFLDFGLTLEQFAVLNAVWAVTIVTLEVPSGALADVFGRRRLLVAAGGLMVLEMAVLCFAPAGGSALFWMFLANRILSGAAEAAASGADEALAYDALMREGNAKDWDLVLEKQMRLQSLAYIGAMSLGAALYDPALMQRLADWAGLEVVLEQRITLRFPLFFTLLMAVMALLSALRMREPAAPAGEHCPDDTPACADSLMQALRLTLRAGRWILQTPYALVIITAGLVFDHAVRMIMTLSSQYYRLIQLPEASFGLIGSGLALLGFFLPRAARLLARNREPAFNLGITAGLSLLGLAGMPLLLPYFGLFPLVLLYCVMILTNFFVSHYLNRITASEQRATVLSFRGLSVHLAYGLIGIGYSLLMAVLRSDLTAAFPQLAAREAENRAFAASLAWFPWYFLLLLLALLLLTRRLLKGTDILRRPG